MAMNDNRLGDETSPYLLQHKDNPVHWRPWGPEALAEAQEADKPILLSVGYAACHWCHVMAHESFENPAIADVMNRLYVNIKVDREERPDIDVIYQAALNMLGQQGGWPLTMFLTPDGEPFWGGTYFPPEAKWGRAGFPDILTAIEKTYREAPDRIRHNKEALRDGLARLAAPKSGVEISRDLADTAAHQILGALDPVHGGIGDAPKFPQASILRQLWSAGIRTGDKEFQDGVLFTLRKICEGGIYDHLGGGFARYTVDREWLVPHFEKMLYDNAQLLDLLGHAWSVTGDPLYRRRTEETVAWLLDDMRMPEGGFASARDADSEGVEGKFYVWTDAEIDEILGPDAGRFKEAYGVRLGGNWEGVSILNRLHLTETPTDAEEAWLAPRREKLLSRRADRIPPLKDDKVLADWNGLTIFALATAGRLFDRPDWVDAAIAAFDFVAGPMADPATGGIRLRHSYRAGKAQHVATLDDYAAMMRAALCLFEGDGDARFLNAAVAWADILERFYLDRDSGAYALTAADAEALVTRTVQAIDNATPSGNGLLITVLAQLHALTGDVRHLNRADAIAKAFAGETDRNFAAYSNLIEGAQYLRDGVQIVIVGPRDDDRTKALLRAARALPLADRLIQCVDPEQALPADHPAHGKTMVDGSPVAFVCRGPVCGLPVTDPDDLTARVGKD